MATLPISEFARHSGISVYTLRRWHDNGLLVAAEVRPESGQRRYHPNQLGHARLIRCLRQADVSIDLIRQMLHAVRRDELQGVLGLLAQQRLTQAQVLMTVAQTMTLLVRRLEHAPADLTLNWIEALLPLPRSRLSVAFVGSPGGIGRTPAAISVAAMLCALGRDVVVVEVSPNGRGALDWARIAELIGDPLPFPVVSLCDLDTLDAGQDLVFDSTGRHEDFLAAAALADKVILCIRAGDQLDFTLRCERDLLAEAGVDICGPNFGLMVTGMPVDDDLSGEALPEDERKDWQEFLATWLVDLEGQGLPVLGLIPHREVHRLSAFTTPRAFQDHHQVLGGFLGVSNLAPPPPPVDYLIQLRARQSTIYEYLSRAIHA